MFHLQGKQRGKIIAVADVGSGSAGVAILRTSPNGSAQILAAERLALSFEERSPEATVAGIIAQVESAAQKALSAYTAKGGSKQAHMSSLYAVIRPPWTRSKTLQAVTEFQTETRIEEHMIDTLAKEALKTDSEFDHANIIETSVIRVELNGYATARPSGKHARHIAVFLIISDCDPRIRQGVSEALTRTFACAAPTFRSGTRALLSVLRESKLLPKDCFVVNMASQGTSLMGVRKGVVVETSLVPEGARSILRRVAGEKMSEETLALMRMLALDQCETEACEAVKTALVQAEPELVKIFGEAISKMAADRRLPNPLILSADENLSPWLLRFFSRIDFGQFTVTTRPFLPKALSRHDLEGFIVSGNALAPDVGLAIASALVNIEESSDT